MYERDVEACIEALCEQGCREVRRAIGCLEKGEEVAETRRLSTVQRAMVLEELRAIMSVYDARPGSQTNGS